VRFKVYAPGDSGTWADVNASQLLESQSRGTLMDAPDCGAISSFRDEKAWSGPIVELTTQTGFVGPMSTVTSKVPLTGRAGRLVTLGPEVVVALLIFHEPVVKAG